MKTFWVLTYFDDNDMIRRQRYDDEESARAAWNRETFGKSLFLDEVIRHEANI